MNLVQIIIYEIYETENNPSKCINSFCSTLGRQNEKSLNSGSGGNGISAVSSRIVQKKNGHTNNQQHANTHSNAANKNMFPLIHIAEQKFARVRKKLSWPLSGFLGAKRWVNLFLFLFLLLLRLPPVIRLLLFLFFFSV